MINPRIFVVFLDILVMVSEFFLQDIKKSHTRDAGMA